MKSYSKPQLYQAMNEGLSVSDLDDLWSSLSNDIRMSDLKRIVPPPSKEKVIVCILDRCNSSDTLDLLTSTLRKKFPRALNETLPTTISRSVDKENWTSRHNEQNPPSSASLGSNTARRKNNAEAAQGNAMGNLSNVQATQNNIAGDQSNVQGTQNNVIGTQNNVQGVQNNVVGNQINAGRDINVQVNVPSPYSAPPRQRRTPRDVFIFSPFNPEHWLKALFWFLFAPRTLKEYRKNLSYKSQSGLRHTVSVALSLPYMLMSILLLFTSVSSGFVADQPALCLFALSLIIILGLVATLISTFKDKATLKGWQFTINMAAGMFVSISVLGPAIRIAPSLLVAILLTAVWSLSVPLIGLGNVIGIKPTSAMVQGLVVGSAVGFVFYITATITDNVMTTLVDNTSILILGLIVGALLAGLAYIIISFIWNEMVNWLERRYKA